MQFEEGKYYKFIYGSHQPWQIDAPKVEYVKYIGHTSGLGLDSYYFIYYRQLNIHTGMLRACKATWVTHYLTLPQAGPSGEIIDVQPATEYDFARTKEEAIYQYYEDIHDEVERMMMDSDNHI